MNTKCKNSERIERLVMMIGRSAASRRQLIADLDLHQKAIRNFRVNYITPSIASGFVKMVLPESPNSPYQAYQLTEKGLELLDKLTENK